MPGCRRRSFGNNGAMNASAMPGATVMRTVPTAPSTLDTSRRKRACAASIASAASTTASAAWLASELKEMSYQWEVPFVLDNSRFTSTFGQQATPTDHAVAQVAAWALVRASPAVRTA